MNQTKAAILSGPQASWRPSLYGVMTSQSLVFVLTLYDFCGRDVVPGTGMLGGGYLGSWDVGSTCSTSRQRANRTIMSFETDQTEGGEGGKYGDMSQSLLTSIHQYQPGNCIGK